MKTPFAFARRAGHPAATSAALPMKSPQELAAAKAARRAEQQIDGPKAMREYRAAEQAARDRVARLRAERLERAASPATARSK